MKENTVSVDDGDVDVGVRSIDDLNYAVEFVDWMEAGSLSTIKSSAKVKLWTRIPRFAR